MMYCLQAALTLRVIDGQPRHQPAGPVDDPGEPQRQEQRGERPSDWTPMNWQRRARIWFYDTSTGQLVAALAQQNRCRADVGDQ